jgi:hypothetical protein
MESVSALKDRTVAYSMLLRPRRMRKTYKQIYVEGRRDISAIQCLLVLLAILLLSIAYPRYSPHG